MHVADVPAARAKRRGQIGFLNVHVKQIGQEHDAAVRRGDEAGFEIGEGDSKISRGLMRRKQVYEVHGGQLYIAAVQPAGAGSIAVQVRQSDRFHPVLSGATSKATAGQRSES